MTHDFWQAAALVKRRLLGTVSWWRHRWNKFCWKSAQLIAGIGSVSRRYIFAQFLFYAGSLHSFSLYCCTVEIIWQQYFPFHIWLILWVLFSILLLFSVANCLGLFLVLGTWISCLLILWLASSTSLFALLAHWLSFLRGLSGFVFLLLSRLLWIRHYSSLLYNNSSTYLTILNQFDTAG